MTAKQDDKIFHDHIQNHFKDEHSNWKVICKICKKTYDEIVKKEKKNTFKVKTILKEKLIENLINETVKELFDEIEEHDFCYSYNEDGLTWDQFKQKTIKLIMKTYGNRRT